MSTYGLPAEKLTSVTELPAVSSVIEGWDSPDQSPKVLEIIDQIAAAKQALYSEIRGETSEFEVDCKDLPVTPLPEEAGPEERQRIALADLELYKMIATHPQLREALGETWRVIFNGSSSWERSAIGPVYTEVALLNPNFALVLNFVLDEQGYTQESQAALVMSKNSYLLRYALGETLGPQ